MRRVVPVVLMVSGLVLGTALPALARDPSPTPQPPPPNAAAEPVCTITDSRLTELSGLVTTNTGFVTVDDGKDNGSSKIYYLDAKCKVVKATAYPAPGPRDPEDLAVAPDGTLWAADIGDNITSTSHRNTIALWRVPPSGGAPVINRLTYPDHAHDAEALLLASDGTPIIVTKELRGPAGIYVPSGPLQPNTTAGVKLTKVGEFTPTRTGTSNFLGIDGQTVVTGGANAPDGSRVALRTYSDTYEWDVPGGDVVKAITTGKPRITPMANEPQGESIAYTRDGKSFLTVSDQRESTRIFKYVPASAAKPPPSPAGNGTATKPADTRNFLERLSLSQITYLVALVGAIGLLLVLVGILGIRRSRHTRRTSVPDDAARAVALTGAAPGRSGQGRVYGGPAPEPDDGGYRYSGGSRPPEYGAPGNGGGGSVYGGAPGNAGGGSVYGGAPGYGPGYGDEPRYGDGSPDYRRPGPGGPGGSGGRPGYEGRDERSGYTPLR